MGTRISAMSDALRADYKAAQKQHALSARRINTEFGHTPDSSWAYQIMDGDISFALAQLPTWIRLTGGEHVLRYLAGLGGYEIVESQPADSAELAIARTGRECSEAVAVAFQAVEDGRVTPEELRRVLDETDEALSALQRLRKAVALRARSGFRAVS